MEEAAQLHVVAPPGRRRERVAGALSGIPVTLHESVAAFREAAPGPSCDVVVDLAGGADPDAFHELCREVADRRLEWTVFVPERLEDEVIFRPVSAGFPITAAELPDLLEASEDAVPPFDLHRVLRLVARIRHDINNPLTAGLAETQLLLMDLGDEGEVGESLETIRRQLHRIRRLVGTLASLRVPAGGPEVSS